MFNTKWLTNWIAVWCSKEQEHQMGWRVGLEQVHRTNSPDVGHCLFLDALDLPRDSSTGRQAAFPVHHEDVVDQVLEDLGRESKDYRPSLDKHQHPTFGQHALQFHLPVAILNLIAQSSVNSGKHYKNVQWGLPIRQVKSARPAGRLWTQLLSSPEDTIYVEGFCMLLLGQKSPKLLAVVIIYWHALTQYQQCCNSTDTPHQPRTAHSQL